MQALVCAVQDQVGHASVIQGLEKDNPTLYTLIQALDQEEGA